MPSTVQNMPSTVHCPKHNLKAWDEELERNYVKTENKIDKRQK